MTVGMTETTKRDGAELMIERLRSDCGYTKRFPLNSEGAFFSKKNRCKNISLTDCFALSIREPVKLCKLSA